MNVLIEPIYELQILLVEDDLGDCLLMSKFLGESHIKNNITVARDGQQALNLLKRTNGFENTPRPDLIFLDLHLPHVTGHELLRIIRNDPQLASIPVIILSSSDSIKDISSAYKSRVDLYLTKPRNLEQYASVVRYVETAWLEKLADYRGQ